MTIVTHKNFTPYELLNWVSDARLSAGEKAVLLALARCVDKAKNGNKVWPGQDTLKEMSGVGLRSVTRHVESLVKLGYIKSEQRKGVGYKRANSYELQVGHYHEPKFCFKEWKAKRLAQQQEREKQNTPKSAVADPVSNLASLNTPKCASNVSILAYEGEVSKETKEKETTPADSPQVEIHKIYMEWEEGIKNYQITIPILTKTDKKQLKDSAQYFHTANVDPLLVIRKAVAQWDRFRQVVKITRGWSKGYSGGGLSPNPTPQTLVGCRKEAVDFYREEEIQAAEDAAWLVKHPKRMNAKPMFAPLTVVAPEVNNTPNLELLPELEALNV